MRVQRIGFIGLGGQGRVHVRNALRLKDVRVVGVSDVSNSALSNFSCLPCFSDYLRMMKETSPDSVVIAVPNNLHRECAVNVAEQGCNILMEKPLAPSVADAKEIVAAVRKNGIKLMVAMCQRFLPGMKELKRIVDENTLGRIEFANARFLLSGPFSGGRVPQWYMDESAIGGGALMDSGCHLIDLFTWMFGRPQRLFCRRFSKFGFRYEDFAYLTMEFKNGTKGLVVVGWRNRVPVYAIELVGQWGRKELLDPSGIFVRGPVRVGMDFLRANIIRRWKDGVFLPLGQDMYYDELRSFLRSVGEGIDPSPSPEEGLLVLEVLEEAYRASPTCQTEEAMGT